MTGSILLPIDLGHPESSDKALSEAVDMARAKGALLHVLTVIPDFGTALVGSYFPKDFSRRALEETTSALKTYVSEKVPEDVPVEVHVRHGTIYREIVAAAKALGVDLVVLASHRPEMKDYFLGPNAAKVVRHARQSVLVVR